MDSEQGRQDAIYSFSGHESFALRYAWLPKAIQALSEHEDLFSRDDDLVILGVGKNMVRSMRHWCIAMGLVEPPQRSVPDSPSELGRRLFGRGGWDIYLEDPGTVWLLHWKLVRRPEKASAWFLAFSQFTPDSQEGFTRNELIEWLVAKATQRPGTRATANSIKRDVDVFIRTYVPSEVRATNPPEDTFDSPLGELGLITEIRRDTYAFNQRDKPTLPDSIFLHSLLEYWQTTAPDQRTMSFDRVAHGLGSPGAAFKLPENALVERLERLPKGSGIAFDETAGMRQLILISDLPDPLTVLGTYYAL
jgi:hypothetical protein